VTGEMFRPVIEPLSCTRQPPVPLVLKLLVQYGVSSSVVSFPS
jgi:hypothetical protein